MWATNTTSSQQEVCSCAFICFFYFKTQKTSVENVLLDIKDGLSPFILQIFTCRSSAPDTMRGMLGWKAAQFTPRSWPWMQKIIIKNKNVKNKNSSQRNPKQGTAHKLDLKPKTGDYPSRIRIFVSFLTFFFFSQRQIDLWS